MGKYFGRLGGGGSGGSLGNSAAAVAANAANIADLGADVATATAQRDAIQAQLDTAIAEGATDAELATLQAQLDAADAALATRVAALETSQAAQDTGIADKADQTALDAEIAATDAEQVAQDNRLAALEGQAHDGPAQDAVIATKADQADLDAEIARAQLAEASKEEKANKATAIPTDGTATDTAYTSQKAVADLFNSLNITGVYTGSDATLAALPAGSNGDWAILTSQDGVNAPGIYVTDGTTFSLAREIADLALLTVAQATAESGPEYTQGGLVSAELLDAWGRSRRMRRIFNTSVDFNIPALGYPDRTAIYIRNENSSSGINVTYGAGGTTALEITHANGNHQAIPNADSFNLQPGEIVFIEIDAATAYASVLPGERVAAFTDYSAANSFGPLPHDGIVIIRDTGEMFGRLTGFNNRVFPADGQPNADWFKVGGTPEVLPVHHHAADGMALIGFNNISNGFTITQPAVIAGQDYSVTEGSTSIYYYAAEDLSQWIAVGGAEGLRGAPVADTAALAALIARDGEYRLVGAAGARVGYTFELGATSGDIADAAGTGFWVAQSSSAALIRETLSATANVFTMTANKVSWMIASGVTAAPSVDLPSLAAYDPAAPLRGKIVNSTGYSLTINGGGNDIVVDDGSDVFILPDRRIAEYYQTGPGTVLIWDAGTLSVAISTFSSMEEVHTYRPDTPINVTGQIIDIEFDLTPLSDEAEITLYFTDQGPNRAALAGHTYRLGAIRRAAVAGVTNNDAFVWNHDTAYGYLQEYSDNGTFRLFDQGRPLYLDAVVVREDAVHGYVIPTATVSKAQIGLTVNGGADVVAPTRLLEGAGAAKVIVTLPAGQMIDILAFEAGDAARVAAGTTAVIKDAIDGIIEIEVADGTGDIDLSVPFTALTSSSVHFHSASDAEFNVASGSNAYFSWTPTETDNSGIVKSGDFFVAPSDGWYSFAATTGQWNTSAFEAWATLVVDLFEADETTFVREITRMRSRTLEVDGTGNRSGVALSATGGVMMRAGQRLRPRYIQTQTSQVLTRSFTMHLHRGEGGASSYVHPATIDINNAFGVKQGEMHAP